MTTKTNLVLVLCGEGTLFANEQDDMGLSLFGPTWIPRPFLNEFLSYVRKTFKHVVLWNDQSLDTPVFYPKCLKEFNFDFELFDNDCVMWTKYARHLIKPLKTLWKRDGIFYSHLHNTLILDDTPLNARDNPDNLILTPTYYEDKNTSDTFLKEFCETCETKIIKPYNAQLVAISKLTTLLIPCLHIVESYAPLRSVLSLEKSFIKT